MEHSDSLITERIRSAMDRNSIDSVDELARRSGIAKVTLHRKLKAPGSLRIAELNGIAEALGVSTDDLLRDEVAS